MAKTTSIDGVLALDMGTSSVRSVVYDSRGRMLQPTLCDLPYEVHTTSPGEVSSDPDELVELTTRTVDGALRQARKLNASIVAVAASCYWHSLMGIDARGRPTTQLLTWADTRSASEAQRLKSRFDERAYHRRTGCFFHSSYWPAKLRWLRSNEGAPVKRTARWISLGEYLYNELFGDTRVSISMASGTGLLDVHDCRWDAQALRLAGISAGKLSPLSEWDQPCHGLRPRYGRRWPELRDIPWFLPLGDGGLANVGAGTVTPRWACATIGTSSALRVIIEAAQLDIPWGTFAYRLDGRRFVLGGALSEGGNVVRWFRDGLGIPDEKQLERETQSIPADSHGLTILPFWAGERSPNWRGDARAVIAGLSLATQPVQILRAAMEAIAYQFATVAEAMQRVVKKPVAVIGTGGQLVHSPVWSQMLADTLDLPVITSPEPEASSRGAALLAWSVLGRFRRLSSMRPGRGRRYPPRARVHAIYQKARDRQERLYELLFPERGKPTRSSPSAAAESRSRRKGLRSRAARR
jgi:gluconokinase